MCVRVCTVSLLRSVAVQAQPTTSQRSTARVRPGVCHEVTALRCRVAATALHIAGVVRGLASVRASVHFPNLSNLLKLYSSEFFSGWLPSGKFSLTRWALRPPR